jgi:anthranilate phosphoribosyltransferase
MTISEIATALRDLQSLDAAAVEIAAAFLLDPAADTSQKAELLRALSQKGETAAEIAAFVRVFLRHAVTVPLEPGALGRPVMDVCGTGGDKLDLFNISTASMFVLAAGGVAVVKHGNRGLTSKSGGADVLEALGVALNLTPVQFASCVTRHGAGFMMAPHYHPAFSAVGPVRKQLGAEGVRTIFNLIGPLLNPVKPPLQLVGVYDPGLLTVYAEILRDLGRERAWAIHGTVPNGSGMDEFSILGPTRVVALSNGRISETFESLPLPVPSLEELKGGDAKTNAAIIEGILSGSLRGAKRDIVLANSAAGFRVAGLADSWPEAIARAENAIDSGMAKQVLNNLRAFPGNPS